MAPETLSFNLSIPGWMTEAELTWLSEVAARMSSVAEIGCWQGRSTFALLASCQGPVTAIDHWLGSAEWQWSREEAQREDIFKLFLKNVGHFPNLRIHRGSSVRVANLLPPSSKFDMVFIDGGHTYEEVKADINAWLPRATRLICGHDYDPDPATAIYPGVAQAVDEIFGTVCRAAGTTLWFTYR